ncbi:MAG: metallophosphoesterase family protein, partial [Acidobacteriota bacterium]
MEEVARTLVVGDIHGKLALFNQLLEEMQYRPERDRLVLIGDLVDRGENSRGVVERAIELQSAAPELVTVLRGNHEEMMLDWIKDPEGPQAELWYYNGGIETLRSYATVAGEFTLPVSHYQFLLSLPTWHEDEQLPATARKHVDRLVKPGEQVAYYLQVVTTKRRDSA